MSHEYELLHAQIQTLADPETAQKLLRVVPGAKTLGAKVPALRELAKTFRAEHPLTLPQACDLMDELCASGWREEMLVGTFILGGFGKKVTQIEWGRVLPWIATLNNWETCDQLASNVTGAMVAANLGLVDELLKLTTSENPWQRRFALSNGAELHHKGRHHPAETLRICEQLVGDRDPNVRKALGWALKEASQNAPERVFGFLLDHRKVIHASALRDAAEKLSAEQRAQLGL